MKFIPAQLAAFASNRTARRNLRGLLRYLLLLCALIAIYSVLFHVLMAAEGQEHTWLTGVYWTLTVMSTLGFGDITFHTDLGRTFSVIVLLSGVVFLLIVFPFTFIHFFYQPWLETQDRLRAPRELPPSERGHVILTGADPVVLAAASRLRTLGRPYVVLVDDVARALHLFDEGFRVAVGSADDAQTWAHMRVEQASLVLAAADDFLNTNIAFTVRERSEEVPILALARSVDSVDVLQLAGANRVVQLTELLGASLARRAYGGGTRANVVGRIDGLVVAEAPATHSALVGQTLAESGIGAATGVTVLGVWERGHFLLPHGATEIHQDTVLVLAGTDESLARFDEVAQTPACDFAPLVILGGGRVGRVVARELHERGLDYRVVELCRDRLEGAIDASKWVIGSAADLATLERAGIREAPTVVVTTRDDATNIYLTIYCRRLRPDLQIVARANEDKNVSTLHRAGANLVMSYTSLGASAVLGYADSRSALHVAEDLEIFRQPLPPALAGHTLLESSIRDTADCSVLAIERGEEKILAPKALEVLREGDVLLLAGAPESRTAFATCFEVAPTKR